ncbi:thermonuclease family protein [Falsirhodobacter sp. 20TX0035]|uniref:thermonuclease family protein n=1 Tax=Falsirhodobacter sp. 20TX0035 TaxID=3022019 RepID=UPI00232B0297|nr:thermonuclease family protein [Falsirhodobacter sp. 20TX0035]MDB6454151.1 thermonuclease family protein [Falsirhodobacter sp. 20TX0035]
MKLNGLSLAVLVAAGGALAVAYSQGRMTPPEIVQEYAGKARVVDGDTLHVAGERIRLVGLDACEMGQPATHANRQIDCGAWATEQMELLIGAGRQVHCESEGRDRYDRPLAICFAGQRNLNLAMLRGSYAFLYGGSRQPDDYRQAEQEAQDAKRGLWIFTDVSDPYDYRKSVGS